MSSLPFDIYRFPGGLLRNTVIRLNQAYFRLRLPSAPSAGHALIGRKAL